MSIHKPTYKKLSEEIINLLKLKKVNEIEKIINEIHPADIADILEILNEKDNNKLKEIIENKKYAEAIIELDENVKNIFLSKFSADTIANDLINQLESDDAVDIILELKDDKKEKVLSRIKNQSVLKNITNLLKYESNTAGSLMATELVKVNYTWSNKKCIDEIRKQAKNIKKVHTIYVVNENENFIGLLSLRKLLISDNKNISSIVNKKNLISVKVNETKESIINLMNKYNLVVLPVLNNKNELIGRITVDDVLSTFKEETDKDYQMASGLFEDININDNIFAITRSRLPWLIIGTIGGIIGAQIIGLFDLKNNLEIAFFIPLIAAMGGNVGVQSSAIVVQGLANLTIKKSDIINKLSREFIISIINGLACSSIIFLMTLLLAYQISISLVVSISIFSVIIFSSIFGTFTPLFLNKYKIDPALATGPFITTVNDIFGLLIYFLMIKLFL